MSNSGKLQITHTHMLSLVMITLYTTHQITGSLVYILYLLSCTFYHYNNQDIFIIPGREINLLDLINQAAEHIPVLKVYKKVLLRLQILTENM